jgi:hypothetical protein
MNMAANRIHGVGTAANRGGGLGDVGAQTLFPGSVHEDGEEITWTEHKAPADLGGDGLLGLARLLASLCLMVRHWPATGADLEAHRVD